MDINKYRVAYNVQKQTAARRGIEFLLTFPEWCEFWGEDIERRGVGVDALQMQRKCDTGPYAVGNIVKGTAKQNSTTFHNMRLKSESEKAAHDLQVELDRLMNEPSTPEYDWNTQDRQYYRMRMRTSYERRYDFKG